MSSLQSPLMAAEVLDETPISIISLEATISATDAESLGTPNEQTKTPNNRELKKAIIPDSTPRSLESTSSASRAGHKRDGDQGPTLPSNRLETANFPAAAATHGDKSSPYSKISSKMLTSAVGSSSTYCSELPSVVNL